MMVTQPLFRSLKSWLFVSPLGNSQRLCRVAFGRQRFHVRSLELERYWRLRALDEAMGETITSDYWTQSLVSALETQKARAPASLAFRAAQIVLGTRALFSNQFLRNLLDPPADGARAASEAHHLFPVAWLYTRGIRE